MSKPKKLQYNGESKVIKYLTTCINWLLDNHTKANPTNEATETLSKIEIDGEVYKIEGGGSPTPSNPQITKVYDDTTSGSSTYTVIQDGLYLIINSYSAYSTHSITLPQGRTPVVSGDISTDRGMSWNVVELQTGDVITIETTPSDWVAFSKVIYRLEDIIVKSLTNSVGVDDSTATLTPPTGTFLMVGVSMGRTSSDYVNNTVTTGHDCLTVEGEVGVNTTIGIYYGNDLPEGNFYGYDGGGGYIALFLAQSGGGGSNVTPNPQGQPTDTLTKIGIGETTQTYYTENSQLCSTEGGYVTSNLDTTLVNGDYTLHIIDGQTEFDEDFTYAGSTVTLNLTHDYDTYDIEITSTTVGMTYGNGAWRNIYCDIYSESSGQTIYDLGTSADKVSYDNTTSGLTADDVQEAIDEVVGNIPTVNDSTIKIQKNGTDVESFSLNQSSNETINITMNKSDVGLGNVDNTSDADKPISTATQTALSGKLDTTLKGANNGLAELDSSGKVPSSQLPSYVDDVVEGYLYNGSFYKDSAHTQLITPEDDKIYVDKAENKTYRWSGSAYVRMDEGVQLGETSSTAYRGDRGKAAYDHSQLTSGNPHNVTKTDVGLGNVPNVATNDQIPTFSQASSRTNIASGEKLSVILGKIMKFFADLKTVAFSGSYNDLSDTPTIPTVNNGTLTIQKNGSNVATFSANQSGNATVNIVVPTKTSELTNDSGYISDIPFTVIDGKLCLKYVKG